MVREVAVTGMGIVCAHGRGLPTFLQSLQTGASGIRPVTLFAVDDYGFKSMGQIPELGLRGNRDRAVELALLAADDAITDCGREWIFANGHRTGVVVGTTCGGITSHEAYVAHQRAAHNSPEEMDRQILEDIPFHALSTALAQSYRLQGPAITITIACASGSNAVGIAADLIRRGQADLVLAGGSDTVSPFTFSGFSILRAMTKEACRPFDRGRDGLALGEGAAFVVVECAQSARQRGAKIYAEVAGHGFFNDGFHSTAPDPQGGGMSRSVLRALRNASINASEIGYVNAHGTGTRANDVAECRAYKKAFADHAYRTPISSTKSMIGHTLGAAGAVEVVATVLALKEQFIPPTINFRDPDPECDLDVVPNEARDARLRYAMCCNAGFGGNNSAVVIKQAAA